MTATETDSIREARRKLWSLMAATTDQPATYRLAHEAYTLLARVSQRCPRCIGSGVVMLSLPPEAGSGEFLRETPCPECQ